MNHFNKNVTMESYESYDKGIMKEDDIFPW